jgi:2,3-bisphosphoglycerate-independent phosphoglycerate mutase
MDTLKQHYHEHDFFYIHVKKTDSYGEDGNFNNKIKVIEEVDTVLPEIINLQPEVIVITGDHSTPSLLKSHSWHPVPTLLYSKNCGVHISTSFSERECARGYLGNFHAKDLMALMLANAGKLTKFGA